MRRLILVPLVLLVLAPTGLQAVSAAQLLVCDAPPAGTTVVGPNRNLTPAFNAPDSFFPSRQFTDLKFQLNLYPATASNKATVNSTLGWRIVANNWDLILKDAGGTNLSSSLATQPEAPASEAVGTTLKHCSKFTIRVLNYQAVGGAASEAADPLQLTLQTGPVK
jgi:hypothetical protein